MLGWGLGEGQGCIPRSGSELSLERETVGLRSHRHSRLREHEARESFEHQKHCKQFIRAGMKSRRP